MDEEDESGVKPAEKDAGRMEAFSDAVMAVIMTIMAFQLKPPQGTDLAAIGGQLHGLFVYVLSFAFIGIYWNNHHHLLRTARRISAGAMWANLLLLFWLSLAPVLTEWLRVYYRYPLPAAAYGLMALAAGFSYLLLAHALIRANGPESAVAWRSVRTSRGTRRWRCMRPESCWLLSAPGFPTRFTPPLRSCGYCRTGASRRERVSP